MRLSFDLHADAVARASHAAMRASYSGGARRIGLFGPSGSGKSTLIGLLAGIGASASGRVTVGDRVLLDSDSDVELQAHERRLGIVFQDGRLFPHLGVRENIRFGAPHADDDAIDTVARAVGADPLLDRSVTTLSGGERQRVALARALATEPDALLLDEPFGQLDQAARTELIGVVDRWIDETGRCALMVSHDVAELADWAEELIAMDHGQATPVGSYGAWLRRHARRGHGLHCLVHGLATEFDERDGTVSVAVDDGRGVEMQLAGRSVRAVTPGWDVTCAVPVTAIAIALGPVGEASVRNRVQARVLWLRAVEDGTLVGLDGGLVALVSTAAAERLSLSAGDVVTALFKSTAARVTASPQGTGGRR